MRTIYYILFLILSVPCFAQKVVDVSKENLPLTSNLFYTVAGVPFSNYKYVKLVEGSPYFNENWMRGRIMMSKGSVYDSILVRIDLMENALHYLDKEGNEMVATSPVKTIWLSDDITGKNYQFDHSQYMQLDALPDPAWYQVLDSGRVILYKKHIKTINEDKPYSSALVEQKMVTTFTYLLKVNNVLFPVKKLKDLPNLLQDKREELTTFILNKSLAGRSEENYIDLISYYNSFFIK